MAENDTPAPAADTGQDDLTPKERKALDKLAQEAQYAHEDREQARREAIGQTEIDNYARAYAAPDEAEGK
jgi:hypothetical protein